MDEEHESECLMRDVATEPECPSQEQIGESVTLDMCGRAFFERKVVVDDDDEEAFWEKLNAWAEENRYWPSIYYVSDHGNVTEYGYDGKACGSWV